MEPGAQVQLAHSCTSHPCGCACTNTKHVLHIGYWPAVAVVAAADHAMHWIAPTSSSCERCLDGWQARNVRQPMLALGASGWVALVWEAGLRTVSSCIASTSPLVP